MKRVLLTLLSLSILLVPRAAHAQTARYALIVQGVSGDESFAVQHRQWLDGMVGVLRDKLGFDASHLIVLAETPKAGEEKSSAESVRAALGKLSKTLAPTDLLFVMLIGHGGGDGPDVTFNLPGPDLTIHEWDTLVSAVPGTLVFVDATSSSFPFLAGLKGPNRIIITATRTNGERYHTVFAEGFIQAFSTDAADLDKNGRISIWEAFAYASQQAAKFYEQSGHMVTEHAVIDDTGKGVPRDASATDQQDSLAALTYLDAPAVPTTADPELQKLYQRQRELTDQVDALRRQRATMTQDAFDAAFEKLEVDLATVSQAIRKKTGGG